MAFRWNIAPLASKRTHVFKPNSLSAEPKHATVGAAWLGKWEQLPLSNVAGVVWEVELRGNKMCPVKPKMWLTCALEVPANSWVQLP